MGVYKELAYQIESLMKQQVQIWPDACDMGLPTERFGKAWVEVQDILAEARESFKVKVSTTLHDRNQKIRRAEFMIPWEIDDGWYSGTLYTIDYTVLRTQGKVYKFFTISAQNTQVKESPFLH